MKPCAWAFVLLVSVCVVGDTTYCAADEVVCARTHAGDLVLHGTESLALENESLCVTGSVLVCDSATVVLEDAVLHLSSPNTGIEFRDSADLSMRESSFSSSFPINIGFSDHSCAHVISSRWTVALRDYASVYAEDCRFSFDFGTGRASEEGAPVLDAVDCQVYEASLTLGAAVHAGIRDLKPGYLENWDLLSDCEVTGFLGNVHLKRSEVEAWAFNTGGDSRFEFMDCEIRQLGIMDHASVHVTGSSIWRVDLFFSDDQRIRVRNLRPGHLSQWELEELSGSGLCQSLVLTDTRVESWSLLTIGSSLEVEDSEIDAVHLGERSDASFIRTTIGDLNLATHTGDVAFEETEVGSLCSPFRSESTVSGSVDFLQEGFVEDQHGPWEDAVLVREYPIEVRASSGEALPDAYYALFDPTGMLMALGKTDMHGTATVTIEYNDDNWEGTWELRTHGVAFPIKVLTSTPLTIEIDL